MVLRPDVVIRFTIDQVDGFAFFVETAIKPLGMGVDYSPEVRAMSLAR